MEENPDTSTSSIPFTLYDDRYVTSDGMRIMLSSLDMSSFMRNPIMLYMHHRGGQRPDGSEVIGRWENIRISDTRLLASAVFDHKDPLARKIERKVREGFLSAASLGIFIQQSSEEERYKLSEQTGPTITKSVLLEISIVDIPRHTHAVKNHCFTYSEFSMTTPTPKETPSALNKSTQSSSSQEKKTAEPSRAQVRIQDAIDQCVIGPEEGRYYTRLFSQDALLAEQLLQCQYARKKQHQKALQNHLQGLTDDPYYPENFSPSPNGLLIQNKSTLKEWKTRDPESLRNYLLQLAQKQYLINYSELK